MSRSPKGTAASLGPCRGPWARAACATSGWGAVAHGHRTLVAHLARARVDGECLAHLTRRAIEADHARLGEDAVAANQGRRTAWPNAGRLRSVPCAPSHRRALARVADELAVLRAVVGAPDRTPAEGSPFAHLHGPATRHARHGYRRALGEARSVASCADRIGARVRRRHARAWVVGLVAIVAAGANQRARALHAFAAGRVRPAGAAEFDLELAHARHADREAVVAVHLRAVVVRFAARRRSAASTARGGQ